MKYREIILMALLLCAALPVFAQSKQKGSGPSRVESELMQLERDIGKANVDRDKAFFQRVEGEEFIFTDPAGGITSIPQDIASLDAPPGELRLVS
jgi:hypothetical protein